MIQFLYQLIYAFTVFLIVAIFTEGFFPGSILPYVNLSWLIIGEALFLILIPPKVS